MLKEYESSIDFPMQSQFCFFTEITLKGFQLWFEENKQVIAQKEETDDPTLLQNVGLQVCNLAGLKGEF